MPLLIEAPRARPTGPLQTRQQLVDARLDQDAAVLEEAAATPHLGAADQFAPMEQDLVGGGAIETDRAVRGGAARRLGGECGRDTQPAQPVLQGKAEPVVGRQNTAVV